MYSTVDMTMQASPLDHAAAGVVLGGCYRFMAGPRPAAAAAAIGGGLGLMGGIAATAVQFASGETVEERWRREYKRQKLAVSRPVNWTS
jgi:hypothetical protein